MCERRTGKIKKGVVRRDLGNINQGMGSSIHLCNLISNNCEYCDPQPICQAMGLWQDLPFKGDAYVMQWTDMGCSVDDQWSDVRRLREVRRLQRIQRLALPSSLPVPPTTAQCPPAVDKQAQNRLIIELALKTVVLMQKNMFIQQEIIALKKETSEFIAKVMSNPENRKRRIEHLHIYGWTQQVQMQSQVDIKKPDLQLDTMLARKTN